MVIDSNVPATSRRRDFLWAAVMPPLGIISYGVVSQITGLMLLGRALDPLIQLALIALGFRFLARQMVQWRLLAAVVYFPVMFVVSWGLGFLIFGYFGWYEY